MCKPAFISFVLLYMKSAAKNVAAVAVIQQRQIAELATPKTGNETPTRHGARFGSGTDFNIVEPITSTIRRKTVILARQSSIQFSTPSILQGTPGLTRQPALISPTPESSKSVSGVDTFTLEFPHRMSLQSLQISSAAQTPQSPLVSAVRRRAR